jgi:hypothetical protein
VVNDSLTTIFLSWSIDRYRYFCHRFLTSVVKSVFYHENLYRYRWELPGLQNADVIRSDTWQPPFTSRLCRHLFNHGCKSVANDRPTQGLLNFGCAGLVSLAGWPIIVSKPAHPPCLPSWPILVTRPARHIYQAGPFLLAG